MADNPKAKRGYSRDGRPACLQLVIALVITTDGFPLAYEVMDGNTSDRTTLRRFLDQIETTYGTAKRLWIMDRGIPTEAILAEMRDPARPVSYLVGTPKSKITQYEQKWLDVPWQQVRESVAVKLFEDDGELYVLAKSTGRQAKETAMRRKHLVRLLRKLRAMRHSLPTRDQLLMRLGAAKTEAGRAYGFVHIALPDPEQPVTRASFQFRIDKAKLTAAQARDGHYLLRSNLTGEDPAVLWTRATDADRGGLSIAQKRLAHPAHPSSARTSRRCAHPDCVLSLLPAGHAEAPVAGPCPRIEPGGGPDPTGDDPADRRPHPDRR
jgi:hypothetical protein